MFCSCLSSRNQEERCSKEKPTKFVLSAAYRPSTQISTVSGLPASPTDLIMTSHSRHLYLWQHVLHADKSGRPGERGDVIQIWHIPTEAGQLPALLHGTSSAHVHASCSSSSTQEHKAATLVTLTQILRDPKTISSSWDGIWSTLGSCFGSIHAKAAAPCSKLLCSGAVCF